MLLRSEIVFFAGDLTCSDDSNDPPAPVPSDLEETTGGDLSEFKEVAGPTPGDVPDARKARVDIGGVASPCQGSASLHPTIQFGSFDAWGLPRITVSKGAVTLATSATRSSSEDQPRESSHTPSLQTPSPDPPLGQKGRKSGTRKGKEREGGSMKRRGRTGGSMRERLLTVHGAEGSHEFLLKAGINPRGFDDSRAISEKVASQGFVNLKADLNVFCDEAGETYSDFVSLSEKRGAGSTNGESILEDAELDKIEYVTAKWLKKLEGVTF